ncbi:AraC family transcriptional regulator [Cochlodiniinecator piscidefendens]|uniref:AraC family transcriptional regulator n=1 Tax=Cochlodiniinecator piscidefendens TaxID=2715756 RepID=UPI00140C2548|nr:AraC family transcriptional regulator [Cochlodiniinecator piscidefendens]
MQRQERYPYGKSLPQICAVLNIDQDQVIRRAGLNTDVHFQEGKGVTGPQFFDLWRAIEAETNRPDFILFLGQAFARGPFTPSLFAFSCSPNVEIGLTRLALFKPLICPIKLEVERLEAAIEFSLCSLLPNDPIPGSMAAFELVFFLECCRSFTAHPMVPLALEAPESATHTPSLRPFLGADVHEGPVPKITLSLEDAQRPLISENAELWRGFESDLHRQLLEREAGVSIATKVREVLLELLPSGKSSVDAVCGRLNVSRRSLQRHLKAEGFTFQRILDTTRSDLSLHYLKHDDLRIEEISYLLAFRDPNSFYRAFHGWTGMTPMQARAQVSG